MQQLSTINGDVNSLVSQLFDEIKSYMQVSFKHEHWKYESEYRIVSKHDDAIDISNAITGLYVLDMESETFNEVSKLVNAPSLIYFIFKGGSVWGLSRYNYGKYLSFQDK